MFKPPGIASELMAGFIQASQNTMTRLLAGTIDDTGQWKPVSLDVLASRSTKLTELQQDCLKQFTVLMNGLIGANSQSGLPPVLSPEKGDRRFNGAEWRKHPQFDFVKQAYLINTRFLNQCVEAADVDERTRNQLRFYCRLYCEALSPANCLASNPEALKLAFESKGQSLVDGLINLIGDTRKGRISMTDETAFEVGVNLAITPGAVVFENPLIQLIQYSPLTPDVHERPLLIVPPCINRFYILDLEPGSSFVRYAIEQGQTVFLLSWRNIGPDLAHLAWDDYLEQGVLRAIDVVREISGSAQVNTLGFCVGGTLLASAVAVLRGRGEATVASLTLLTTMLDFVDTGEIGLLIDESGVADREQKIGQGGLLTGRELSSVFASLRANDLIWPYVVNNYLNSDGTNLPGPMYCWYVRNTYLENNLKIPGKTVQCGVPVDLSNIDMPVYLFAAKEDHIVPWQSAYATTALVPGPVRFVLGASGHIAGVINPASRNKRNFWCGGEPAGDAEQWLLSAQTQAGSWWPDWCAWLAQRSGKIIAARSKPGSACYPEIEPAPGRYVKETHASDG